MSTKQIKFRFVEDDEVCAGILVDMDDKYVICGCHGAVFPINNVVILQIYNDWMDLSECIMGD